MDGTEGKLLFSFVFTLTVSYILLQSLSFVGRLVLAILDDKQRYSDTLREFI
jgi:hypothetical protein